MVKQVPLKLNTSYSETKSIAEIIKYLNSLETAMRDLVELSLCCLYAPATAANSGATLEEVKARAEISRQIFETQMSLAMGKVNNFPSVSKVLSDNEESEIIVEDESEEELSYVDFDEEEF